MADETPTETPWPARVQRWGAPTRGGRRAYHLPDHATDQLRLAHRMRNDLVRLALDADDRVAAVWSSYPAIEQLEQQLSDLDGLITGLAADIARSKSAARSRKLTGADAEKQTELREARTKRRALRAARKEAKAAVKIDAKSRLQDITAWTQAETKRIRQEYAAAGLYWGTYNDVIAHDATANKRVMDRRKKGQPSRRRFRSWDGSGALAVQLQRQTGDPARTVDRVGVGTTPSEGKTWVGQLQLPQAYGRRVRGVVRFGLGSDRDMVRVPVVAHRALPDDADVTGARLVVERVAGQTWHSIHVTARVRPAIPKTSGPTLAVHVGWRRDPDLGGLRVATWRSDTPLQVPGHLQDVVTQETPTSGRVVLPALWRRQMANADRVRGERDDAMNRAKGKVADWLTLNPQPVPAGEEPLTPARVKAWRSQKRLAWLAHRWRQTAPVGDRGVWVAGELEAWRKWDKAKWETEAHGRRKAIGRRRDAYRRFAAWVARECWRIVVDDTDLAAIARAPKTGEPLPGVVEDAAAAARVDAAPGELRAAVTQAGARDGCVVVESSAAGLTRRHAECGFENPADGRYAVSAVVVCDGCGGQYDQDVNAVVLLLAGVVG